MPVIQTPKLGVSNHAPPICLPPMNTPLLPLRKLSVRVLLVRAPPMKNPIQLNAAAVGAGSSRRDQAECAANRLSSIAVLAKYLRTRFVRLRKCSISHPAR
jgi:hypothetical protein